MVDRGCGDRPSEQGGMSDLNDHSGPFKPGLTFDDFSKEFLPKPLNSSAIRVDSCVRVVVYGGQRGFESISPAPLSTISQ